MFQKKKKIQGRLGIIAHTDVPAIHVHEIQETSEKNITGRNPESDTVLADYKPQHG